jgi:hypothetical protein
VSAANRAGGKTLVGDIDGSGRAVAGIADQTTQLSVGAHGRDKGAHVINCTRLAAVSAALYSGAAWAEPASLQGDELRRAVSGKTVVISTPLGSLPILYRANGSISGKASMVTSQFLGGPKADEGRWWVSAGELCQQWKVWLDGRKHCYRMRVTGATVHWRRDDGRTGTAVLVQN